MGFRRQGLRGHHYGRERHHHDELEHRHEGLGLHFQDNACYFAQGRTCRYMSAPRFLSFLKGGSIRIGTKTPTLTASSPVQNGDTDCPINRGGGKCDSQLRGEGSNFLGEAGVKSFNTVPVN